MYSSIHTHKYNNDREIILYYFLSITPKNTLYFEGQIILNINGQ